ncbi:hypothetical protein B1810_16130 [Panacagrimonas perspica]|uniref:DUF4142 domain-containing protein n=1 Tax=Panacagrimonas perspica TaxID=381431 RepID=UPI00113CE936|nr:hypothetical protein B1810_16130 [Panacagrimonas perspica]
MFESQEDDGATEDVDHDYRARMIRSHRQAVLLFEEVFRNSRDPGVRKLAGQMLPALQPPSSRGQTSRGDIPARWKTAK